MKGLDLGNGVRRYDPYKSNSGHLFYTDKYSDGSHRSVWVHRDLMKKKLGRTLMRDEFVHHVNEIKTDNRTENFELKTPSEHSRLHAKRVAPLQLTCKVCGVTFERPGRHVRRKMKLGQYGPFCSKSCSGQWSRQLQIDRGINSGSRLTRTGHAHHVRTA